MWHDITCHEMAGFRCRRGDTIAGMLGFKRTCVATICGRGENDIKWRGMR